MTAGKELNLNLFDKSCAALALALGAILTVIGGVGFFAGCNITLHLPPILGIVPLFAGWGIFRSVIVAWRVPSASRPFNPSGPTARKLYGMGVIVSLVAAVTSFLLVLRTLSVGALPDEPLLTPTARVAVFGTATVLFGALASFCGSRIARIKSTEPMTAEPVNAPIQK